MGRQRQKSAAVGETVATRQQPRSIIEIPLADCVAAPLQVRVHTAAGLRALTGSLGTFGAVAPIVIDKDNRIVSGHGRVAAAKLLGWTTFPAIRVDDLTPEQIEAYKIADNRLAERSSWNDRAVAEILRDLSQISLGFDLEVTGFEQPEIDFRIQSLQTGEEGDEGDVVISAEQAVSRLGDQWLLGVHRLICGSALDVATYAALMNGEKVCGIWTDPPYNVPIVGHVVGNGKRTHREFPMASGEMSREEFCEFLITFLRLVTDNVEDGGTSFICMDWRHLEELMAAVREIGHDLLNVCVWVKANGGMGSLYRSQTEFVVVISKHGTKRINNVQLGKFGRNRTNVWNYAGMNSFARRGQIKGLALHPTVKPLAMVADAILDVTPRDGIVLDPFCGSGTTIIAAEQTGRRGYCIELDPLYVDTSVRRWERFTGQQARHSSGKTFAEVALERLAEPEVGSA